MLNTNLINDKLQDAITTLKGNEKQERALYNVISNVRLLVFVTGALLAGFFYSADSLQTAYIILIIFIMLFGFFVVKHDRIGTRLQQIGYKIKINEQYLDRIHGEWIGFANDGQDLVDGKHPYTSDLDIFGPKSLFQWINVTYTFYGRKILRDYLGNPEKDVTLITKRQQAVKELAGKLDFCQEMQSAGMGFSQLGNDPEGLLGYAENSSTIFEKKWMVILAYILPVLTLGTIVLSTLKYPISAYIPFALLMLQSILTVVAYIKIAPVLQDVYKIKDDLSVFSRLIKLVEEQPFADDYLSQLKATFVQNNQSSSLQIKKLHGIIGFINVRYSAMLHFVLNICFLWDYHCLFSVQQWKRSNGQFIRQWIETIGYFEGISSLAVILQINPQWCFPVFAEHKLKVVAQEIGHPLITEHKRVCNHVEIDNDLCIITGSNMSGKTTLLRTVGINLVLAYSGAPVCAKSMECSMMKIFTSMRIMDDVNSGISTFYAELMRIKMIVDYAHKQENMIFLIDEIFRGTNSRDRIIGAGNVIRNLSKDWIVGLISTHDLELCDLEYEKTVKLRNYHFAETYVANEMKFDYLLRKGRSHTTNAQYLMKMVGIEWVD